MENNTYRVNAINSKGKEVWRYTKSVKTARRIQDKNLSIDPIIYIKKKGKFIELYSDK